MREFIENLDLISSLPIPPSERINLNALFILLHSGAQELETEVTLKVVGGTLTKPWPRKDIDVTACVRVSPETLSADTELHKVTWAFDRLSAIVKYSLHGSRFHITSVINPYMDSEFQDPNILAHDGSILIQPDSGTPIELINLPSCGKGL